MNLKIWLGAILLVGRLLVFGLPLARSDQWIATAKMMETRQYPGLARLGDGRILAVSGHPLGGKSLSSAEIYDPAQNIWTPTGSLIVARNGVQPGGLAMLPNGKILIAGSGSGSRSVHEAELFDPKTETWTSTGSMSLPRCVHTSTQLFDGRVLVCGGIDWMANEVHSTAEIYDPVSGTWHAAGSMKQSRWNHRAVRLDDGKVLVIGGAKQESGEGIILATAEMFDPASRAWESVAPMHQARRAFGVALMEGGKVLVAGGRVSHEQELASCEIFDPTERSWKVTAPMSDSRAGPSLTRLSSGDLLVVGGMFGRYGRRKSAELFDPANESWADAPPLQMRRNGHRAIRLDNGNVLVVGGFSGLRYLRSCELFVPESKLKSVSGQSSRESDLQH